VVITGDKLISLETTLRRMVISIAGYRTRFRISGNDTPTLKSLRKRVQRVRKQSHDHFHFRRAVSWQLSQPIEKYTNGMEIASVGENGSRERSVSSRGLGSSGPRALAVIPVSLRRVLLEQALDDVVETVSRVLEAVKIGPGLFGDANVFVSLSWHGYVYKVTTYKLWLCLQVLNLLTKFTRVTTGAFLTKCDVGGECNGC